MKVKDLMAALKECDPEADIYFIGSDENPANEGECIESIYEVKERTTTERPIAGVYLRGDM